MICNHPKTEKQSVKRETLGSVFKYETLVCLECNAYLRGEEYEKQYMHWLSKLYEERRDKFQIQCQLSDNLLKCVDKIIEIYPGCTQTLLLRALTVIYINHIDINPELADELDKLIDKNVYNSLSDGVSGLKKVNIQFKPKMLIEIISLSEFLSERPSKLVESSIETMVSVFISSDKRLKDFWKINIHQHLDSILKAA